MEKIKSNNREVRVIRLLKLIAGTEEIIDMSKKTNNSASVKGHIQLKNKLVNELLELLNTELKIQLQVKKAA